MGEEEGMHLHIAGLRTEHVLGGANGAYRAPSAAPPAVPPPSAPLLCSRTPTQNCPSKKMVNRAETVGRGGALGSRDDEDDEGAEGTEDSFGCE